MAEHVIDVSGVTKSFGKKTVVKGLSMQVKKGQIYGFLGPNGSGKTTFMRMLCGLLLPDSGQGTCLGYDIRTQSNEIKRHVGYMAQHFSLYEDLSVRENLDFVGRIFGISNRKQAVNHLLETMNLLPFADQLAGTLSGGWKQRLALASCLIHDPQLLLLDEPTAGVDPKARREFWDILHDLTARGITALITTHYMDEAERCHSLAYIAYGDLLTSGTVDEVVDGENLTTWELRGPDLMALEKELSQKPGVDQAVFFGNSIHVSGKNAQALEKALEPLHQGSYKLKKIRSSLEEVFISLMTRRENG